MNDHKIACAILVLLIAAMSYGVNVLRGKSAVAKESAQASRLQAEASEAQTRAAGVKLKALDAKTAALRDVYADWLPHFSAFRDPQDGERRISELIRSGEIFLISQKFDTEQLDKESIISHALRADLVIEDDYTKVMNWLGKVEETIPAARINRCVITRGERGNDIHLELSLQVPVFRDAPEVAAN